MRGAFSRLAYLVLFILAACRPAEPTLFEQLPTDKTHIAFQNTITPTDSLNGLTFTNFYNGGGVGAGDFNNDGLPDLVFTGNQVSCRLYLNRGQFAFDDITQTAGLTTDRWCTGVSLADVNQDGWLDMYISVAAHAALPRSENLLFINQGLTNGIPTFREMAAEYGLANPAFTTQSAFFDYDLDGDLDVYLLNTAPDAENPNHLRPVSSDGTHPSTGTLYRNEGLTSAEGTKRGHPVFRDVSKEAGIGYAGLGLGLAISDINKDGYPDIYCSNDFQSSDILYLNDRNGHFVNVIKSAMAHTSLYGMGVDVADINNDALPDIMQLDMLPETNARLKMMLVGQDYDRKQLSLLPPYNQQLQYMRNSLQLNLGNVGPDRTPRFSEIGLLAGVARTDWSWSALLADYDNDGRRDLYITNGYRKNVTDRDFISYTEEFSGFGTTEAVAQKRRELMNRIPEIPLPHYAYKNTGDLSFTDVSARWGLNQTSFANGATYADLDNDGDLDLVVNNIDAPAFVYRNQTQETLKPHYLTLRLRGNVPNRQGIGAAVTVWSGGQMQYAEQAVVRGYLSSVDATMHIGLGGQTRIDSLRIDWPGGATETLYGLRPDQTLTLVQATAKGRAAPHNPAQAPMFDDITDRLNLTFAHRESDFVDFKQTAALHKMLSRTGFALTTGDVNGDSLVDIFVGGAYRGSPPSLLIQRSDGGFTEKKLAIAGEHDDSSALLFDADGDRDLDLYVVSGGNEQPATNASFYQHRLYLNNGRGDFLPAPPTALPNVSGSGSCVVAADFDHDNDLDLFVGGRQIPGLYPLPARSYLLRNDGGRFVDMTAQLCPALLKAGLVCGALWSDYNNDGWADLILAGEWMPITMFTNQRGRQLTPLDNGLKTATGWWNNLVAGDFDGDGDTDYVVGNEGLNSIYQASAREPVRILAKDFNSDGTFDPLMGYYLNGVCYPALPRDALNQQIIQYRRKYQHYADYAAITFDELLTDNDRSGAYEGQATYLQSAYVENRGNGRFTLSALPRLAQQSPVYGLVAHDFTHDGKLDLLLTGNFYPNEVNMGRQDASVGLLLAGDGHGHFAPQTPAASGLLIHGDARTSVLMPYRTHDTLLLTALNGKGLSVNLCLPGRR